MKTLRILAIDDHEMTMLGYKLILESIEFEGHNIIVDTATSYQTGKKLIEDSVNTFRYDILFLDVQLFAPNEEQPYTGEDLGILARKQRSGEPVYNATGQACTIMGDQLRGGGVQIII